MGLLDSILTANNGAAMGQIAKQLGIPEPVAKQAASSLLPALSRGLQRNTEKPGGLESLLGALTSGNHSQYVEKPETIGKPESIADGNAILGHILGSKDVSRNVAGSASKKTGIDSAILKSMLPMLGTVAMGALAKQAAGGKGGSSGDVIGALSGLLGEDGDDSMDDILDLAKKFL